MTHKKRAGLLFVLVLFLGLARSGSAFEEHFSTGKDWLKLMSAREKYMSLLPPSLLFHRYDVRLRRSLPEYIGMIDFVLRRNPNLENEDVSNIFASTVYFFEPENRDALRTMEMNFLAGNFELKPYQSPRLSIEEILKEASA